jgi:hypothetical protein
MIDEDVMVLQNNTNVEDVVPGPCGEMYRASEDANQAINVKPEGGPEVKVEEDPEPITFRKMKAEPEVSYMFLYVHF